ncbi:VCBS repeat-containing protein [Candidatus Uhrbacteria bacterium]|nr:VCBS repeat-containing protein [Candidatus Uhrbacteria bacterium]
MFRLHQHKPALLVLELLFCWFAVTGSGDALTDPAKFPRIGNYYLRAGTDLTPEVTKILGRYDLLVLPAEAQIQNPTLFGELRRTNPDIVILAYVPTLSFNHRFWRDTLHQKLLAGIEDGWWLRDQNGNRISIWPGTEALNLTTGWAEYLARYAHTDIMRTGLWDGIFFDEVDACITCRNGGNIDINRDGVRDETASADRLWRGGYTTLLRRARELMGQSAVLIINGSSTPEYQPYVSGRMFESFPTPWEGSGRWEEVVRNYLELEKTVGGRPPLFFVDGDTENTGVRTDYRDVRFGLTSTLLGGGYFGYDHGTTNHGQLWWYDEYDVFLGRPRGSATDVRQAGNTVASPSVWRRDFEKGIVLVNSTGSAQSVSLQADFEKLHGVQDPTTNDGAIISRIALPPTDGAILLRVSEEVLGMPFPNGAFARIFNPDGTVARTGFFLYDARARGGTEVTRIDLDHDGTIEAVSDSQGRIEIRNADGTIRTTFAPYGDGFRKHIHHAIHDINRDGRFEIVTGAGAGGGPHVRIFHTDGRLYHPGFFAYDKNFRGGVEVAVGDIDGDGQDEIITGAGAGGAPEVRIFRGDGTIVQSGFMAYDARFRGGVNVAAGDLDGDGKAEIVTGAGRTGGPHVRIFDGTGRAQGRGFFPYDAARRDGVIVGISDITGDGKAEIFALTTDILP